MYRSYQESTLQSAVRQSQWGLSNNFDNMSTIAGLQQTSDVLLEDEDELTDGNDIDSDDELEDQVEVNDENTDTENSDYGNESESNSNDIDPILQNKYFFGKDNIRWIKKSTYYNPSDSCS
ncbi:Hypothetical protein CINCED_3A013704 [Cinara cedri]|uniref:Uncharacterized protein n=1 Tax=Cinara cedri TaxID=506608 RepID=A0A5E4N525_9HEMI|nr:Hypothetical protein CINCED_3A013704 [Cinara cedri]